jgi:DNA-binding winged helix-turn-helix (wHTH) protein/TolB-like protein
MNEPAKPVYEFGEFRLDSVNKALLRNGLPVALTPKVFDTLELLVKNAGQLVEKDQFLHQIWPGTFVEEWALAENISRLRRALGDAEGQRFIVTVPKRGYRLIAAVKRVSATEAKERVALGLTKPSAWRRPRLALLTIAVLLVLGVTFFYFRHSGQLFSRLPAVPIRSLAVLPLENLSRDPEQEYFADGMTDELITQLSQISALRVISRTSIMRYKGTRKPLGEIARELNVDAVVEGTVLRSAERVRVTAQSASRRRRDLAGGASAQDRTGNSHQADAAGADPFFRCPPGEP